MTQDIVTEINGFHVANGSAKTAAAADTVNPYHGTLESALESAKARFAERNPVSSKLHQEALKQLPGGNTRSLLYTSPFPLYVKSGTGYKVSDEDGHDYIDFVGELTAGLYGHSHPTIQSALIDTITATGLNLGGTTSQEARYAALLCTRFNLDRIRFANTGTEANLHVLNAARKFTGKRKVVVFKGGYHGAVLSFKSGVAENNVDREEWIVARYNDVESAEEAIAREGVAAVIVEPMLGAGGGIPATKRFLEKVQDAAKKSNVLFIIDEVMTSRLAPGGLQSVLALKPDLTALGKYLGGGLPFGAFGGREDIMACYDPRRADHLMHNGTFNNNTLTMHAGYAGLSQIYTPEVCVEFNKMGDRFREKLNEVTKGTKLSFTGVGTILTAHCTEGGIEEVKVKGAEVEQDDELKELLWMELLERGYWYQRRGTMAVILGTPEEELNRFVDCVEWFVGKYESFVRL